MGRRTPVNVEIIVRDQSQIERMIKKFSRKVKKSGVLEEVKKRKYYVKKSVKKRLKRKEKKRHSQLSTEKHEKKFQD